MDGGGTSPRALPYDQLPEEIKRAFQAVRIPPRQALFSTGKSVQEVARALTPLSVDTNNHADSAYDRRSG